MLTRADVMPLLLAACPSFRGPWTVAQTEPDYAADLLYPQLGDFARHLIALVRRGETAELPGVFAVVERLQREGDPDAQDAAILGFLETLQSNAEHADLDPVVFVPYLGPASHASWHALDQFWFGPEGRHAAGE